MNSSLSQIYWYEVLRCPPDLVINEAYTDRTALNSVAIITGKPWKSLVRLLIEQAHFRCNMPTYKTCVTDMLRASGFKPLHDHLTLREAVGKLNAEFTSGKEYIVKLRGGAYYALVPDRIKGKYVFKGCKPATATLDRRALEEMWLYVPGSDNRTGITRSSTSKRRRKEASSLENTNENPAGRLIGDCVVRALATACECSWHEAVDFLAETSAYENPQINAVSNITGTLKRLGFIQCPAIKVGRHYISATQICPIFDRMYHSGERIFAYLGTHHCAAIVPTEASGTTGYKIQDTWDSTSREVIEYWVLKRPEKEKKQESAPMRPTYKAGDAVKHPAFGDGIIRSVIGEGSGQALEIEFPAVGIKKISAEWLRKNIPPEDS